MTIQPDYVKEELLHELSESFCMHNQLPPDLFTRYRIKRGLRLSLIHISEPTRPY